MVTFPNSLENILDLREAYPEAEIGLHFSITSGRPLSSIDSVKSLVDDYGNFYSIGEIVSRLEKIDLKELERELMLH